MSLIVLSTYAGRAWITWQAVLTVFYVCSFMFSRLSVYLYTFSFVFYYYFPPSPSSSPAVFPF